VTPVESLPVVGKPAKGCSAAFLHSCEPEMGAAFCGVIDRKKNGGIL